MRTKFKFEGCWNGKYHWVAVLPMRGDSRHEHITCDRDWFWRAGR